MLDLQKINLEEDGLEYVRTLQESTSSSQNILVELVKDKDTGILWVRKTENFPEPSDSTYRDPGINSSNINHLKVVNPQSQALPITGEIIVTNKIWERSKVTAVNPYDEQIIPALFYKVVPSGEDKFKVVSYSPYVELETLFQRLVEWNGIETEHLVQIFKDFAKRLDILVKVFHVIPKDHHWKNILVDENLNTFLIDFGRYLLLEDVSFQGNIISYFFDFIQQFVAFLPRVYMEREKFEIQKYGYFVSEGYRIIDEDKARMAHNETFRNVRDLENKPIDFENFENNMTFSMLMEKWVSFLLQPDSLNES